MPIGSTWAALRAAHNHSEIQLQMPNFRLGQRLKSLGELKLNPSRWQSSPGSDSPQGPRLPLPEDFAPYQDVWVRGRRVIGGKRRCNRRYKFIYDALVKRYRPGFTVLDVGASEGYFSIRLAEELDAYCTLLEKKSELATIVEAQRSDRLTCRIGRFSERTLARQGQFDVVIAVSIVHHFADWGAVLRRLFALGDTIIIELPAENERATKRSSSAASMWHVLEWYGAEKIGQTGGYASEATRDLYVLDFPRAPSGDCVFQGTVRGGRGSSTKQRRHYLAGAREKTGRRLIPGTLNLSVRQNVYLRNGLVIESEKGPYHLFPCRIEGLPSYIVKPPRAKNAPNTLEVLSELRLREVFGLDDKDSVAIEIPPEHLTSSVDEVEYPQKGDERQAAEAPVADQAPE